MVMMRLIGDFNDPEMECCGCNMIFTLFWQRTGHSNDHIEYCPFCGAEVDEIVDHLV